jgi:hypothetical protein
MLVVQEDQVWLKINCHWWLGRNGRLILRGAPVID